MSNFGIAERARANGIHPLVAYNRLRHGWDRETAVTVPIRRPEWASKEQAETLVARLQGRNLAELSRISGIPRSTIGHIRARRIALTVRNYIDLTETLDRLG